VFDTRFAFDYYRPLPDTRVLGGGRMSTRSRSEAELSKLLYGDLLRVYPQLASVKVTHAWSGLMSYARQAMPQIGRLPDGLWYALGFGGHGVAPTTIGGEVLADAMTGAAPVPAQLAAYGLQPTYGAVAVLGLAGARRDDGLAPRRAALGARPRLTRLCRSITRRCWRRAARCSR
jgi:gamma-glutamylputrescine oxidase